MSNQGIQTGCLVTRTNFHRHKSKVHTTSKVYLFIGPKIVNLPICPLAQKQIFAHVRCPYGLLRAAQAIAAAAMPLSTPENARGFNTLQIPRRAHAGIPRGSNTPQILAAHKELSFTRSPISPWLCIQSLIPLGSGHVVMPLS